MTYQKSLLSSIKKPISIFNDPWETYNDIQEHNALTLSNIEFTMQYAL